VKIETIQMWICLYDLPADMMTKACGKLLGGQIGRYIKTDRRFPGYMRIRVHYPLVKPLMPELKVKIKGRGLMNIVVRYENVPHFCFLCGLIGHAMPNCVDGDVSNQGIKFGEELRASPLRRIREIAVVPQTSRVVRTLFHVVGQGSSPQTRQQGAHDSPSVHDANGEMGSEASSQKRGDVIKGMSPKNMVSVDLAEGVKEMRVARDDVFIKQEPGDKVTKDRVSFGTNMSTEDESSATESL
jgi:hypothetical protein